MNFSKICTVALILTQISVARAAEKAPPEMTLELAQKIAAKAAACGKKNNWKFSIAVVNAEGNLVYFQRTDGSYLGSVNAAIDKAKSANAFQRTTKEFADGVKGGRLGLVTIKDIVAIEGGVPVKIGETFVGGLGLSGAHSPEDHQCASSAIE